MATSKPDPTPRADARRNRERMLDAAAVVLSRRADASLVEIADEAQLSRATAYRHFADVESIRAALAEEAEAIGRDLLRDKLARLYADDGAQVSVLDEILEILQAALPLEHRWTAVISGQPVHDEGLIKTFAPMARAFLLRGQGRGEFRDDLDLDVVSEGLIAITMYAVRRVHSDGLAPERALSIVQPYLHGLTRGARRPEATG
ncbi:MAG: hypothetical protein AAGC46_19260 [Solirubrobacteraceae bacterium]|nr:hypothetical protein [Patulibacter sp.]